MSTQRNLAPWHRQSFDRCMGEVLPRLLREKLPVQDYHAEEISSHARRIAVGFGAITVAYEIPQPDANGIFLREGQEQVVIPQTLDDDLATALIACVGEQLAEYIALRLPEEMTDAPTDEEEARALLPLDAWCDDFLAQSAEPLQTRNWLDRQTCLRRLFLPERQSAVPANHLGRICPIESPEGDNIGRLTTIARGASIRDGRLEIDDDSPTAHLGLTAATVPFIEHSDAIRVLIGVNNMRQCPLPPQTEPALVQTGLEPDEPDFWCGANLLTAYIPWGVDTFEDALAISTSCAARLSCEHPVEPGDLFTNRHGTKGVISRILPDDEMPHLPDGTVVDLVCSFTSLPSRMSFGQVREAVLGRIGRAEGRPALAPPFAAPDEAELRARLKAAGLPEDGREQLNYQGQDLAERSTVGWVYWGLTQHRARNKIHATVGTDRGQRQGEMEFYALRKSGAYETIREQFSTRAHNRPDISELADRVAQGPVPQASGPTPQYAALVSRLRAAGIELALINDQLQLRFAAPEGDILTLVRPIPHPWLSEQILDCVGLIPTAKLGAFPGNTAQDTAGTALVAANDQLQRVLASKAPARVKERAEAQFAERVSAYIEALVGRPELYMNANITFSGRSVIVPGVDLRPDQIGVPEDIAWSLFAPLLAREQPAADIAARTPTEALDRLMADQWILATRAPVIAPSGILAFRPVRIPDRAIRLHPLACAFFNADYDVDQMALFLPITAEGQREAGERLTLTAHIDRDPALIHRELWRVKIDAMYGLARLSLEPEGRREITELVGFAPDTDDGLYTERTISAALSRVFQERGSAAMLELCDQLFSRGLVAAKASGASLNPFIGAQLTPPPTPTDADEDAWDAYAEEAFALFAGHRKYTDGDLGPLCLLSQSGGRSFPLWRHLYKIAVGGDRQPLTAGLEPAEFFASGAQGWQSLYQIHQDAGTSGRAFRIENQPTGFDVLARAKRSQRPGVVFARAAQRQVKETLTDDYSRLFAGLAVENRH